MRFKRESVTFKVNAIMQQAWELQWQGAQERAKEFGDNELKVTASDMVNQVRKFATEQLDGKTLGSTGPAWGGFYGGLVRIRIEGARGSLLDVCRTWLLTQTRGGRLESFNFGRGHISGARFRMPGTGLSTAEKQTMEAKANRKPYTERVMHHRKEGGYRSLCVTVKQKEAGQTHFGSHRSHARSSTKQAEVTCPQCLNLLKGRVCFSYVRDYPYKKDGNTNKAAKDIYFRVRRFPTVQALLAGKPYTEESKHHEWKDAKAAIATLKKETK